VTAERLLMALLLGGVAVGCVLVLHPFLSAILWAAILVFSTWPLYRTLQIRLRLGRTVAAGVMVALVAVLVVLPLAAAIPGGADDADRLRTLVLAAVQNGLPPAPHWLWTLPVIGPSLGTVWDSWAADLSVMGAFFKPYMGMALSLGVSLVLGLANGVLDFLFALIIAFFFYASGDRLAAVLTTLLRRIAGPQAERLIAVTGATVRGVVYGILGTAIVQGLLTVLGLWVAGVPRAVLLGVVAGSMSVLPIGAPFVWIPASLWLLTSGRGWAGALLAIYGVLFISGSDNLIRPYFIIRGTKLPFLVTLLGVLGGALAFGLLGIFVGPVLLSVGYTLVGEWTRPGSVTRSRAAVLAE
jgi:predicted PurR-regulated permease PerM